MNEILKENLNSGDIFNMYFWRDNHRKEIDLILEYGTNIYGMEIRSGKTIQQNFFDGLRYWIKLTKTKPEDNFLIYGGTDNYSRNDINVIGWNSIKEIINKLIKS